MIHDYPLIAVTDVLNAPSVDSTDWSGYREIGTTEDIIDQKLLEVLGYGWDTDEEICNPIHFFEYKTGDRAYGHNLSSDYDGVRIMGNGHHRLAFQAYVQGALFVHYTDDQYDSGW